MIQQQASRPVGRPPLTDRHALLRAAREIGFPGLTVGAVTAAVGVKYSTFYRHYPSLEALVVQLVDEVCAEVELPPADGTWQTQLTDTCGVLADLLERNPGLAETIVRLPGPTPGMLRIYHSVAVALRAAGFDAERAVSGASGALEIVAVASLTGSMPQSAVEASRNRKAPEPDPVDPALTEATVRLAASSARERALRSVGLLIKGLESELRPDG